MHLHIPWWMKVGGKLVLSRLPVSYRLWRRLNMFRHGLMDDAAYAYAVFVQHFERAKISRRDDGFVCLELGPGDSLLSALIARAFGASAVYLIDTGNFAQSDLRLASVMADFLEQKGLAVPEINGLISWDQVLERCHCTYLTNGLSSLKAIPDSSIDFVWSHAVLEHIRRTEFGALMKELRRVIRPDGACSHRIDLEDHLGGRLNNLRFSSKIWESNLMATSGFYTNRLRYSEMLGLIQAAGFEVEVAEVNRWTSLPISKQKIAPEFHGLSEDELRISGFAVVMRPVQSVVSAGIGRSNHRS